jgi:hypothetical protein
VRRHKNDDRSVQEWQRGSTQTRLRESMEKVSSATRPGRFVGTQTSFCTYDITFNNRQWHKTGDAEAREPEMCVCRRPNAHAFAVGVQLPPRAPNPMRTVLATDIGAHASYSCVGSKPKGGHLFFEASSGNKELGPTGCSIVNGSSTLQPQRSMEGSSHMLVRRSNAVISSRLFRYMEHHGRGLLSRAQW